MERMTNQKQLILEYLRSVKTHPTAEEVYHAVKKKLPRISLATVYRNLEKFAEENLVLEIKGETKRFDGDIDEHYHFVCENCHKVFDISEKKMDFKKIRRKFKYMGKVKELYIYGICKKCGNKLKN